MCGDQTFSSFLVVEVKDRSPVSSTSTSISVSTVCLGLSREIVGHPAMAAGNNFSMSSLVCNSKRAIFRTPSVEYGRDSGSMVTGSLRVLMLGVDIIGVVDLNMFPWPWGDLSRARLNQSGSGVESRSAGAVALSSSFSGCVRLKSVPWGCRIYSNSLDNGGLDIAGLALGRIGWLSSHALLLCDLKVRA